MVPSAVVALGVPGSPGRSSTGSAPARSLAIAGVAASAALLVASLGAHWVDAPMLVARSCW